MLSCVCHVGLCCRVLSCCVLLCFVLTYRFCVLLFSYAVSCRLCVVLFFVVFYSGLSCWVVLCRVLLRCTVFCSVV